LVDWDGAFRSVAASEVPPRQYDYHQRTDHAEFHVRAHVTIPSEMPIIIASARRIRAGPAGQTASLVTYINGALQQVKKSCGFM
jgi:hypothetical protein